MWEGCVAEQTWPGYRLQTRAQVGALSIDVDLSFEAPWTVLFGPSGAGKTTLLRAACGLGPCRKAVTFERAETGAAGPDLLLLSSRPIDQRDIAYMPQHGALFPHLTVEQNVRFGADVCEKDVRDAALIDEAMTTFQLHLLGERYPESLSGGERRRVALARAFATPSARLMLLDEPFAGLDREQRDAFLPAMREQLNRRRLPVLSVTHDVEEALLLQAEVVVLEAGAIVRRGPARQALAAQTAAMLAVLSGA
jgi:molybdate transport system ATP-binding protein